MEDIIFIEDHELSDESIESGLLGFEDQVAIEFLN